ncbi:MAG: acyl-ACP thioesterase domain-containing protein [Bacteroidales bacterium]|jgi:acyl-ACP thioesterase
MEEKLKTTILPIYEETYPVFSFLLDPVKRLSIPAAFGILGDAAGRDAARRGWGYEELVARNQAWVLIRSKMVITRQPLWGEHIILRTWPKLMEGVVAYRDFQILDMHRNVLMAGSTAWTLMDLTSRKPVRLIGKEYDTGELANYHAISEKPMKINWPANLAVISRLTAQYGQLDMNNHVNNTRYIEWILNEMPVEVLITRKLTEVEVNFIAEVKQGDEIQVLMPDIQSDPHVFYGFIRYDQDHRQAFAAKFTFN